MISPSNLRRHAERRYKGKIIDDGLLPVRSLSKAFFESTETGYSSAGGPVGVGTPTASLEAQPMQQATLPVEPN